jgi:hypothetical protein
MRMEIFRFWFKETTRNMPDAFLYLIFSVMFRETEAHLHWRSIALTVIAALLKNQETESRYSKKPNYVLYVPT